jgi:hypothetical protein
MTHTSTQFVTSSSRDADSVYSDPVRWLLEGTNCDPTGGPTGKDAVEWVVLHDASKADFRVPKDRNTRIHISPLSGYQEIVTNPSINPSINGGPPGSPSPVAGSGIVAGQRMTNKNKESLRSVFNCFNTDGEFDADGECKQFASRMLHTVHIFTACFTRSIYLQHASHGPYIYTHASHGPYIYTHASHGP